MEPRYRDGDIILVHKQSEVYEGELGIFVCGGPDGYHGYFKRFGGDRLVSLNPAYPDIPLDSFESVVCCGKVIGHLPRRDV
jgi:phage repressor protein C with HTH and peptisase S24 domain